MRTRYSFVVVLAMVLLVSCRVDLEPPTDVAIGCQVDSDCPSQAWVCNPNQGICVSSATKDFDPPTLVGDVTLDPSALGSSGVTTLTLVFNEPLRVPPRVWFVRGGEEVEFAPLHAVDETTYVLTYTAGTDDVEGEYLLQLEATDDVHNTLRVNLDATLRFDFTPPTVLASSLTASLAPGDSNVIGQLPGQPEALAADGTVVMEFVVSEPLSATPELWLLGPGILPAQQVVAVGQHITATFEMSALEAAPGTYLSVRIAFTDLAGNAFDEDFVLASEVAGADDIVLDVTAPNPADVETERAIVFVRAPWGQRATNHESSFGIVGSAGAVESRAYVTAYATAMASEDDVLAFVRANVNGSFGPLDLGIADRTQVFVRVADAAGNFSPLTRVRDTDWIVSTSNADAVGSPPNPHPFYVQPRAAGLPITGVDANDNGDIALGRSDGDALATLGAGQWLSRLESFEPDWRYRAHMFNDPSTNELYLMGGTVSGSNVTTCDGSTGDCPGLYRRKLISWEPVANVAAPGEDLPTFGNAMSVTYDVSRKRVVGYDSTTRRLWEWSNGAWRPHRDADPSDLGPYRQEGARLVYDAVRAQLVLFGGTGIPAACDGSSYCNRTWVWNGSWQEVSTVTKPPGRINPVMVYDSVRDVVVLTAGFADVGIGAGLACGDGSTSWALGYCYYNDLWEFDGSDWQKRCDGNPASDTCSRQPFRVELAAGVFDPSAGQMLIFGGRSIPGSTGPACADASAKDTAFQCVYSTSWTWDGSDWQRYDIVGGTTDTDPLSRWGATLGYDIERDKIALFGGIRPNNVAPTGFRQDTYEWQGDGWLRQRNPYATNPPGEPRMDFAFARTWSGGAFLYGGEDLDNETCGGVSAIQCTDAHYWGTGLGTTPGWTDAGCDIGTSCPLEAGGVRAAYDPFLRDVVIVGGRGDGGCESGGVEYCQATWTADGLDEGWSWVRHQVTMMPRAYHAMAEPGTTAGGNVVCNGAGPYLFGGSDGATYYDSLHKYNVATGGWTTVCSGAGCNPKPTARIGAGLVCDDVNDALILFGGELAAGQDCGNGTRYCGDTWRYQAGVWQQLTVLDPENDGAPAPRAFHVMTWDADRQTLLLHGGQAYLNETGGDCGDGSTALGFECLYGDVWEWTGNSWARVNQVETDSQGSPGRRARHGMAYLPDSSEVILHGGRYRSDSAVHTWYWQSGHDSRPRQVFEIQLSAAQASSSAVMQDVAVSWDAGGIADDGTCSAQNGAELLVLQAGTWSKVAQNNANTTAPAALEWRYSEDPTWQQPGASIRTQLLLGSDQTISVAVQPRGNSGCYQRRAQVSTDYGEVSISYRQAAMVVP